jgi:hypothetical protein
MDEKILNLAKKLQALAERGHGGERENAEVMLTKLANKYSIDLKDLQSVKKMHRIFKFDDHFFHKKFVQQVIASVIGEIDFYYAGLIHNNWAVEISDVEYIEISEKLEFYWPAFLNDLEIFYTAFIQKNELFLKADPEKKYDLNPTDDDKLRKAFKLMNSMSTHIFIKMINQSNEQNN